MSAFGGGLTGAALGTLTIRVLSDANQFIVGMQSGKKELNGFDAAVLKNAASYHTLGLAISGASALMIGALGLTAKKAIEFDDAFVGIAKTAGPLSEHQLPEIRKEVINLSTVLPVAATELSRLGMIAGQLGVDGKEDLLRYIRTAAMLGETTDLSSERAISALARVAAITNQSTEEMERMADVLIHLGNRMNANEAEIMEMERNLVSVGYTYRYNSQEVLGLAAAMAALGLQSQASRSAFLTISRTIDNTVTKGGEKLEQFAELAGTTSERFAEVWRTNPMDALKLVVSGLGQLQQEGGNAAAKVDQLFSIKGEAAE